MMEGQIGKENLEECASFFRKNKAYARMFAEMKKKFKKYGKITGKIHISKLSEAECAALGAVFGKILPPENFQFPVSELQKALDETKYCGVKVEQLVETYFQERMVSNSQKKEEEKKSKELFWEELFDMLQNRFGTDAEGLLWLRAAREQKKYGCQLIMKEREKSEDAIKEGLWHICQAVEYLLKEKEKNHVRLAVLGAKITKNPHYFDRQNIEGRLLIGALSFLYDTGEPQAQEDVLSLYYMAGIKSDDISSYTACYGIHFYEEEGEHQAYQYFVEKGEKYVLTLSNLDKLARADSSRKKVFIIENQMVFSQICEEMQGKEYSLMCTSGQLRTASLFLIDMLIKSGCELYYCGDIDPEGIEIADKVMERGRGRVFLWRMAEEDYYCSRSEEELTEARLKKLDKIKNIHLQELAEVLRKEKRAGYQEHLIHQMVEDILRQ